MNMITITQSINSSTNKRAKIVSIGLTCLYINNLLFAEKLPNDFIMIFRNKLKAVKPTAKNTVKSTLSDVFLKIKTFIITNTKT